MYRLFKEAMTHFEEKQPAMYCDYTLIIWRYHFTLWLKSKHSRFTENRTISVEQVCYYTNLLSLMMKHVL